MSEYRLFRGWQRGGGTVLLIFFFSLLPHIVPAQTVPEVDVRGGFLSDSLKIGEQTAYYLTARYPSSLTVLFPDSTHAFAPFEYVKKEYFLTRTTGGISVDSTLYYLTTFEVDRVQYLRLPVYVAHPGDCTIVETEADSVLITQLVAEVPDTVSVERLPLKMNTAYEQVQYDLNFWLIVIIVTVAFALAVAAWLVFGKRIQRYFRVRRLRRNHAQFLQQYNALVAQIENTFSTPATESALIAWKRYMEQLESRPYTKLTTRETLRLVREPALTEPLSSIDRAIYGHDTTVVDSLENLKKFADQQFNRKMKEVQHG